MRSLETRWRGDAACGALLFVVAVVLRLWGMSRIHYWDEMVYLQNAQVIGFGKTNYSELAFRPPLLSIYYAAIFKVWHSIYAADVGAALLNALAPVFLFLAGKRAVGWRAAMLASGLLAVAPFFVGVFPAAFDSDNTGNSLLSDSPALTLITLSFWLLLRAIDKPSFLRFLWGGVALAMCVLMRFGSLSTVAILFCLVLLSSSIWRAAGACFCGIVAGLGPYLAWCWFQFGDALFTVKQGWAHVEGPTPPFTFFLRNALVIFSPIAIFGLGIYVAWKAFPRFVEANVNADSCAALRNDHRRRAMIEAFLVVWLVVAFLTFSCIAHKEPRYVMPAAPPLFLLSGMGLSLVFALRQRVLRWLGTAALAMAAIVTVLPLRALFATPFIDRNVPDEARAAEILAAEVPPDTTLYMSFNYPTFAYYTPFRIHELQVVGPELYAEMQQVPAGQVLVLYRNAEAPSQSDVAWCEASGLFKKVAEYPSLVVYRRRGN